MSDVDVSLDFSSSADAVWKELADFGGIGAWAPGVVSCKLTGSGVGAVRAIEMPGGAVMEERLEALDESGRTLSYSVIAGAGPLRNYLATIEVSARGDGCRVAWRASFETPEGVPAEGIAKGVSGAYAGMLAALKSHLGEP